MGKRAPAAAPLMKSPSSRRRTGAGLPAGKAMDSENVPREIRAGLYAFNLFRWGSAPLAKTLNEAMSSTLSWQFVAGLLQPALPLALCLIDPLRGKKKKRKKRAGMVSFPKAKPPFHTFHTLPGHVHSSLIRTGVFCGCSGAGSLKRLGLGTAPALFPSSPLHIPSRKHFICGSGKGLMRGWRVLCEKQQVIGCVMCLEEEY